MERQASWLQGQTMQPSSSSQEGVNGFVAPNASPDDLASAIMRVHEGGAALRRSTSEWYRDQRAPPVTG